MSSELNYRADVDGLRAVAVIPVLLFHGGITAVSGGFVGVDVFFVISGFLITSIIQKQLAQNRFSLLNFYERRARRILPALFTVIAVTLLLASIIYTPNDFKKLGESIISVCLFASNLWFMFHVNYFAEPDAVPLLHTWSLAVEEQYYLIFPIFLLLLWRFKKEKLLFPLLLIFIFISLVAASVAVFWQQEVSFYFTPLRAWELLAGSLLAIDVSANKLKDRTSSLVGGIGLILVFGSIVLLNEHAPFPGLLALPAVLGTCMIIYSGVNPRSLSRRILSNSYLVGVGKISYSLYLWHYPIFMFLAYIRMRPLTVSEVLFASCLSIFLAWGSWKYIEAPFRSDRIATSTIWYSTGIGVSLIFTLALFMTWSEGAPGRFKSKDLQAALISEDFNEDRFTCALLDKRPLSVKEICKFGEKKTVPTVALWGDSHGEAWRSGFDKEALAANVSGLFYGGLGCPPLIGVEIETNLDCKVLANEIHSNIVSSTNIKTVVFAARWPVYVEGEYSPDRKGQSLRLRRPGTVFGSADINNFELMKNALVETVVSLEAAGKDVWIIGPTPELLQPTGRALTLQSKGLANPDELTPTQGEFLIRNQRTFDILSSLEELTKAEILFPSKVLCNEEKCKAYYKDAIAFHDGDHLSNAGARALSHLIEPIFTRNPQSNVNQGE